MAFDILLKTSYDFSINFSGSIKGLDTETLQISETFNFIHTAPYLNFSDTGQINELFSYVKFLNYNTNIDISQISESFTYELIPGIALDSDSISISEDFQYQLDTVGAQEEVGYVIFDTVEKGKKYWNAENDVFIADKSGKYTFSATVEWEPNTTGYRKLELEHTDTFGKHQLFFPDTYSFGRSVLAKETNVFVSYDSTNKRLVVRSGDDFSTVTNITSTALTNGSSVIKLSISADGTKIFYSFDGDGRTIYRASGANWSTETVISTPGVLSSLNTYKINKDGTILVLQDTVYPGTSGTATNHGRIIVKHGTDFDTTTYINNPDTVNLETYPTFGEEVAISGDGSVIAVWEEEPAPPGLDDACGRVHVFYGTSWTSHTTFLANQPSEDDYFGYSLALNYDGSVLVAGAYWRTQIKWTNAHAGAVIIRYGTNWSEEKVIEIDSNINDISLLGSSVDVSDDGSVVFGLVEYYSGWDAYYGTDIVYSTVDSAVIRASGENWSIIKPFRRNKYLPYRGYATQNSQWGQSYIGNPGTVFNCNSAGDSFLVSDTLDDTYRRATTYYGMTLVVKNIDIKSILATTQQDSPGLVPFKQTVSTLKYMNEGDTLQVKATHTAGTAIRVLEGSNFTATKLFESKDI